VGSHTLFGRGGEMEVVSRGKSCILWQEAGGREREFRMGSLILLDSSNAE